MGCAGVESPEGEGLLLGKMVEPLGIEPSKLLQKKRPLRVSSPISVALCSVGGQSERGAKG